MDFNPLHHEGGDRDSLINALAGDEISIHSTTRVETRRRFHRSRRPTRISIHSTTRVETSPVTYICLVKEFQSTPPRGWRRLLQRADIDQLKISIHSTTRVETVDQYKDALYYAISIHSTTRVETAILHNNHYYSSTHFHKQIISHPLKSRPTIPLHSQIRSHCANFPVRISP